MNIKNDTLLLWVGDDQI